MGEISPIYSYGRYVCAFPEIIRLPRFGRSFIYLFIFLIFPLRYALHLGAYRHQTYEANHARLPPPLFSSSFPSLRRLLVCPLPHLLGIACPPPLRSKYYTALRFFLFRHDVYCTCCALAYISYIGEVHRGGEIVMMHGH